MTVNLSLSVLSICLPIYLPLYLSVYPLFSLGLYEAQKSATKKAQLLARELAVIATALYNETRRFQAPELGTCTNQCQA